MYEYECELVRVIDGDTVVLDVSLGFHTWFNGTFRMSDYSAPERSTLEGLAWKNKLETLLAGGKLMVKTDKDPRQSFARWLASMAVDGKSVADLMDPDRTHRYKHEG